MSIRSPGWTAECALMPREPRTPLRSAEPSVVPDAGGGSVVTRMQALSDATRLRLLRLLEHHELGVAELCEVLQLPQSTVSRHLKTLADGGWLVSRRESTTHLYRILLDELDPLRRELWLLARRQTDGWATAEHDTLRLKQLLAARDTSRGFFAGMAADWDRLRQEQYGRRFDVAAAFALLPSSATVVDLGCGTGQLIADIAPFAEAVIGVDTSPQMLKAARRHLSGLENVELLQGELAELPIDSGACDAATCVLALSYVEDPVAVICEMKRILKPGGRAVVVDLLAHDRNDFRRQMGQRHLGFSPRQIRQWLAGAGLADVTVHPLPPEPQAKGPALFVAAGVAK